MLRSLVGSEMCIRDRSDAVGSIALHLRLPGMESRGIDTQTVIRCTELDAEFNVPDLLRLERRRRGRTITHVEAAGLRCGARFHISKQAVGDLHIDACRPGGIIIFDRTR